MRVADADRRVRLQEQVRDRLADDVAPADDDGPRAVDRDLVLGQERHDPERRRRHVRRPAEVELAGVERVDAVDVLDRVDRAAIAAASSIWPGSGSWTRIPSIVVVGVQLGDGRVELLLGDVLRQLEVGRVACPPSAAASCLRRM